MPSSKQHSQTQSELEPPIQDELSLLSFAPPVSNSNVNSEWNLLIQDTSTTTSHVLQDKEYSLSSYQYNPLTLGIPEPNWSNMGLPSYSYLGASQFLADQEMRKQSDLMPTTVHLENEHLTQQETQSSPKLSKDCRAYNCVQFCTHQEYYQSFSAHNFLPETDSFKHSNGQMLSESDTRFDIPKIPDLNSDLSSMMNINLTESIDNVLVKVDDTDDESDIIVEESDTESEISISDVGPSSADETLKKKLRCIVCTTPYTENPAANFIQLNNTFPLTFVTKTPVAIKLFEIIPFNMQNLLKFENTLICRRCLNLIDTAENLEFKLITIKQELCGFLSKSQLFLMDDPSIVNEESSQELPACKFSSPPKLNDIDTKTKEQEEQKLTKEIKKNVSEPKIKDRDENGNYQCDRCGKIYSHKYRLMNHLSKHMGSFNFKCTHCNKGFSKDVNLQIHLRTHKDERLFQCQICPASFIEEVEFASHVCLERKYMCDNCPKIFTSQEKLDYHHNNLHNKKKNICEVCSKEFKHPSALAVHYKAHSDERQFLCDHCGRGYKSQSHLNNHIKTHSVIKCPKCDQTYITSKELTEHNNTVHRPSEQYKCPDCDKTFAKKRYLKAHERVHLGKNVSTCPVCQKTFRYSLKIHMMTHASLKKFKCELCNVQFTLKSALDKHNRQKHQDKKL